MTLKTNSISFVRCWSQGRCKSSNWVTNPLASSRNWLEYWSMSGNWSSRI
jgi:hypothetical protein